MTHWELQVDSCHILPKTQQRSALSGFDSLTGERTAYPNSCHDSKKQKKVLDEKIERILNFTFFPFSIPYFPFSSR